MNALKSVARTQRVNQFKTGGLCVRDLRCHRGILASGRGGIIKRFS